MTTLTKSTGTVTLTGAVEKVTLPAAYGWVWVKNMSDGDMFVGLSDGISAGADGVMRIPAGECGRVQTDGQDFVYLMGSGNALVVAQNYADCPFKVGGKGGEIPDLSAYAKKTDVPTQVSQLENDSGYLTKHPVIMPDAGKTLGKLLQFGDTFRCMTDVKKDGNGHIIAIYDQLNTLPNIPAEYAKKTDIPTELPANGGSADYAANAGNAEKLGGKDASAYSTSIIKSVTFSAATTNGYIWTGIAFPKYIVGIDLEYFDVIVQFYKGSNEAVARAEWAMMFFSKDDMTTPLNGSFNGTIYYID